MNGTTPLHVELEREIADWMGTEDALCFTTGYQVNLGTIGTLLEPRDTVIVDSGDHASILDGCKLSGARMRPFRHNRIDKLERMLERAAEDGGGVLVVVDGVFSMEGDIAPLPDIVEPASATAPDCSSTRRTGSASSASAAPAPASSTASRTRWTCGWGPSRRASPPAAASSPARRT